MDATKGQQKWSGFGVGTVSEAEMMDQMAMAYNQDRNERDYEVLISTHAPDVLARKTGANTYKQLYEATIDRIPNKYRADKNVVGPRINGMRLLVKGTYSPAGSDGQ